MAAPGAAIPLLRTGKPERMNKIEPTVANPSPAPEAIIPPAPTMAEAAAARAAEIKAVEPAVASDPRKLDQLSRIEEKAARIEEKFARYEAVLTRAEASLERSAQKVDLAAGTMDFAGLRDELSTLRQRVNATPRFGALLLTGIVTAILTVILTVIVLKNGFPGILPPTLPR
jgi:hypothetical protein